MYLSPSDMPIAPVIIPTIEKIGVRKAIAANFTMMTMDISITFVRNNGMSPKNNGELKLCASRVSDFITVHCRRGVRIHSSFDQE